MSHVLYTPRANTVYMYVFILCMHLQLYNYIIIQLHQAVANSYKSQHTPLKYAVHVHINLHPLCFRETMYMYHALSSLVLCHYKNAATHL